MRNLFKKLLFCGALAVSGGAFAAPIDGVYQCTFTSFPLGTVTVYQSLNTNSQGQTVIAPAALELVPAYYGFGVGVATSTTFIGTDSNGAAFAFAVSGTTMTGTMSLKRNGIASPSTVSCSKIW
jgi:hypothetical protein